MSIMLVVCLLGGVSILVMAADPNPEKEAQGIKTLPLEKQAKVKRAIEQKRYERMLQQDLDEKQASRLPRELGEEVLSYVGEKAQQLQYLMSALVKLTKIGDLGTSDRDRACIMRNNDNGNRIAALNRRFVRVWDVASKEKKKEIRHDYSSSVDLAFDYSLNGEKLAYTWIENQFTIYDIATGNEETIGDRRCVFKFLKFSPSEKHIAGVLVLPATPLDKNFLQIYDIATKDVIQKHDNVRAFDYSPDGKQAVVVTEDAAKIVNIRDYSTIHSLEVPEGRRCASVTYNPQGDNIAAIIDPAAVPGVLNEMFIRTWKNTGEVLHDLRLKHEENERRISSCSYSKNGKYMVALVKMVPRALPVDVPAHSRIKVWDVSRGTLESTIPINLYTDNNLIASSTYVALASPQIHLFYNIFDALEAFNDDLNLEEWLILLKINKACKKEIEEKGGFLNRNYEQELGIRVPLTAREREVIRENSPLEKLLIEAKLIE